MRFPKDHEIISAIRLERNLLLVRREGNRTTSEAGLTLPVGIKTPFAKIIALGPDYKGPYKKGDRLLYSAGHVIPEIDIGTDKQGNCSIVDPEKILAHVPAEFFDDAQDRNGGTSVQTNA